MSWEGNDSIQFRDSWSFQAADLIEGLEHHTNGVSEKSLVKQKSIPQSPAKNKKVPIFNPAAFEPDQTEQESVEDKKASLLLKLKESTLDQERDYPHPVSVISIVHDGQIKPWLTLKSFSLWQGKAKSKKTTALAIAISRFILRGAYNQNSTGTDFYRATGGKALWIDTEQGQSYAARTMKLILKLAGIQKSDNLVFCDVREHDPDTRLGIIQAALESDMDIRIVVIDGLVDLMNDFMDAKEGHHVITEILKLCSINNIHIAGVLHQNKADKNARAHIGTIASQKCEVEISAEIDSTDRTRSTISCVVSRGLPFEPFTIQWTKGSLPCIVDETQANSDPKPSKTYTQGIDIAENIFKGQTALTRTDSEQAIMLLLGCSESTAKRRMNEIVSWKMVEKGEDGRYRRVRGQKGSGEGS